MILEDLLTCFFANMSVQAAVTNCYRCSEDSFNGGCIKVQDDCVFHFESLKLSEEEQPLEGFGEVV